jgi:hypothetical protein
MKRAVQHRQRGATLVEFVVVPGACQGDVDEYFDSETKGKGQREKGR